MSVVVLLNKLKIKDLEHKHYFFKNITRLAVPKPEKVRGSADLAQTYQKPRKTALSIIGEQMNIKLRNNAGVGQKQNY